MDQKRAMLYPPIEPDANVLAHDQRRSASTAIGLPTESPPSYDVATASSSRNTADNMGFVQPTAPIASPVIVVQPKPLSFDASARSAMAEHSQFPHQQQQHYPQPQPQPFQQQPTAQPTPLPGARALKLGPEPCAATCPVCGNCKTTRMCYTPNTRTHVCALVLCLVGWCFCACFVPYCMNSCRTGNHYCSQCNAFLGTYNPRRARR